MLDVKKKPILIGIGAGVVAASYFISHVFYDLGKHFQATPKAPAPPRVQAGQKRLLQADGTPKPLEQAPHKVREVVVTAPRAETGSAYVVKQGDTLSQISERYYGSWRGYPQLASANHIQNPDKIRSGQHLTLIGRVSVHGKVRTRRA